MRGVAEAFWRRGTSATNIGGWRGRTGAASLPPRTFCVTRQWNRFSEVEFVRGLPASTNFTCAGRSGGWIMVEQEASPFQQDSVHELAGTRAIIGDVFQHLADYQVCPRRCNGGGDARRPTRVGDLSAEGFVHRCLSAHSGTLEPAPWPTAVAVLQGRIPSPWATPGRLKETSAGEEPSASGSRPT